MTKETIYNKILEIVMPEFEKENKKFVGLAISSYHPILVVEILQRRSTKKLNAKGEKHYKWVTVLDHYQPQYFKGVEKLYQQYLKAS